MNLLLIATLLLGINNDLIYMRELYVKAALAESQNRLLLKTVSEKTDAVSLAYKGAATMLMAKHCINPYTKLKHFNEGREILESAIKKEPHNVEARYVRLTIQTNLPTFLGYKSNIASDRSFLVKSLKNLEDVGLEKIIRNYLLLKADLSEEEKNRVSKNTIILASCKFS